MILVGDFLQLKPVPSAFDNGDYVFCSLVFRVTFPHRNELTIILRQREEDVEFLGALRELRLGQCSEKSHRFLSALSRNLDANTSANATHIFFKKLNASLHNFKVLRSLPGEFIDIHAEIDGESPHIDITASCPAERVVRLKKNCKVMLLWNKSEDLRNGSQGVFLDMETASVAVVRFPGVGVVNVGKETWLKRDRYGVVVGSVTQVPLVPCYAITCHKSQGQTVPAVIVHCSQEFVSSLTYVALSRVKSADHLQVINFKPKFLAAAPQAVTSECWTTSPEEIEKEDLTCCRNQELMDSSLFCATDRTFGNHNDNIPEEALVNFPPSAVDDDFLKNIFEEECQQIISLVEVNATLQEHEEELSQPPESLNRNDLLSSLKSPEARAGTTGHAKNLLLDSLQLTEDEHTHEKLIAFLKVIWNHLFNIVDNHTAENLDETITKITRQQFTAATGDLHAFFKSQEYKAYLHDLFGVSALTKVQSMELKEEVFKEVVTRHVHMGANQFLRDFRLEYKIRKTAELRKRVLQRQKKAKERQDMVKFEIFEKAFDVGRTFFHLWRKPSTKTRRFHKSHQSVGFLCKTSSDCQGKARRIVIVDLDNEASTFDVHRNFCISG
ncbi:hypothetical protein QZH41_003033 [Actinostola sp. cb2023]|nr:hypothetical protein QZH41_003033 [Actinostola sp. cb2023]